VGAQPHNKPQYDYNPATAKRLLDEAGWKDQDGDGVREAHGVEGVTDGTKFSIEVHTNAGNQEREQVMVAIQQYWAQVGVEVKTASVEWNALLAELMETHEYDVVVVGFTWECGPDQKTMWHTESYGGGFNVNKYSNPDLDKF
jgi:peptide/nickel transport system substrate-binding protein